MKRLKNLILAAMMVAGVGLAAVPAPAQAINVWGQCGTNSNVVCNSATKDTASSYAMTIINTILYILGIVAVIMIVIGGFRYVVSNGDSASITAAKNTIFYAVIGLVVAILAFTIVNFVVDKF